MTETRPAWGEPLQIGSVTIPGRAVFAPMAGVSDLTFRLLCKEQGAGLLYTEMASAKAIIYKNPNTGILLRTCAKEHPIAVQLFGSDPDAVYRGAQLIEELPFDLVDFNMGCPVPKVFRNGEGSALMKDPERIERIRNAAHQTAVEKFMSLEKRFGLEAQLVTDTALGKDISGYPLVL